MARRLGALLLILAASVGAGGCVRDVPLETISCPVHAPGQTPWPEVPAECRDAFAAPSPE